MTLYVETRGSGPDLVLLHGWALHGGMWGPWLDELCRSTRLHLVDLPGHGRSPWLETGADLGDLASRVLPHVPSGAAVLGWSLGGLLALELARRRPRHLAALVLVATTPRFLAGQDWEHGMQPEVLDGFTAGLQQDYRRTVQNFLALQTRGDENGHETLRLLRGRLGAHGEPDPRALAAGLDILQRSDMREALPQIALPALVIAGEHDRITPPGAGLALAGTLPSARFCLVERCGHAPFLSHPAAVLAEVLGFLGRHLAEGAA
jgi:pimeloyl-[acyl-carrier protein] methyl ester esterase